MQPGAAQQVADGQQKAGANQMSTGATITTSATKKSSNHQNNNNNNNNNNNHQQQQQKVLDPAQMHMCRLCDKLLSSSSSLDRHMLTHSGERPFVCKRCHMTFTTNGNMHRHMRTHLHKDSLARQQAEQMQLKQSLLTGSAGGDLHNGAGAHVVAGQLLAAAAAAATAANENGPSSQLNSRAAPMNNTQQLAGRHQVSAPQVSSPPVQRSATNAHYQLLHHLQQQQQHRNHHQLPGATPFDLVNLATVGTNSQQPLVSHQTDQTAAVNHLLNQQLVAALEQQQRQLLVQSQPAPDQPLDISTARPTQQQHFLNNQTALMMNDDLNAKTLMMSALAQAANAGAADLNQTGAGLDSVKAVMLAAAAAAAAAAATAASKSIDHQSSEPNNLEGYANDLLMESTLTVVGARSEVDELLVQSNGVRRGKRRKQVKPSRSQTNVEPLPNEEGNQIEGPNMPADSPSILGSSVGSSSPASSSGLLKYSNESLEFHRGELQEPDEAEEGGTNERSFYQSDNQEDSDELVAEQLVKEIKDEISGLEDFNNNNQCRSSASGDLKLEQHKSWTVDQASELEDVEDMQEDEEDDDEEDESVKIRLGLESSQANERNVEHNAEQARNKLDLDSDIHSFSVIENGERLQSREVEDDTINANINLFSNPERQSEDEEQGCKKARTNRTNCDDRSQSSLASNESNEQSNHSGDGRSSSSGSASENGLKVGGRQSSSFVSSSQEIDEDQLQSSDELDQDEEDDRISGHEERDIDQELRHQSELGSQLKGFNHQESDQQMDPFTSINDESDIIEDISQSYVKTSNPNATRKGGKRNRHCYKCKLCTYSSVDRCTLVRHLRIHSGERPYICGICRYAFTTKANCERHVRKRHKKQYNSLGGSGGVKGSNGGGRSLIITDHSNHQTIPVKVNPVAAQTISQTLQRIQEKQDLELGGEDHELDRSTPFETTTTTTGARHQKQALGRQVSTTTKADNNIVRISSKQSKGDQSNGSVLGPRSEPSTNKRKSFDNITMPAYQRRRLANKQQQLVNKRSPFGSHQQALGSGSKDKNQKSSAINGRQMSQTLDLVGSTTIDNNNQQPGDTNELLVNLLAQLQRMTQHTSDPTAQNIFLPQSVNSNNTTPATTTTTASLLPIHQQHPLPLPLNTSTIASHASQQRLPSSTLASNIVGQDQQQQVTSATFLANMLAAGKAMAQTLEQNQQFESSKVQEQFGSLLAGKHLNQQFAQLRNLQQNSFLNRKNPFESLTPSDIVTAQQALDLSCKLRSQR